MEKEEIEYWRHAILYGRNVSNDELRKIHEMEWRNKEQKALLHAKMIENGLGEMIDWNRRK